MFWRSWHAQPAGVLAYARKGAEVLVGFWPYLPYEDPHRNAVWLADHFELNNDVITDGHTTSLVKPWLTIFEDDATRRAVAWALTTSPGRRADADVVCATIAAGIRIRLEDGVQVGGIPGAVRWDNDPSFNSCMVLPLGIAVGFECHTVPPCQGNLRRGVRRRRGTLHLLLRPGRRLAGSQHSRRIRPVHVPAQPAAQLCDHRRNAGGGSAHPGGRLQGRLAGERRAHAAHCHRRTGLGRRCPLAGDTCGPS